MTIEEFYFKKCTPDQLLVFQTTEGKIIGLSSLGFGWQHLADKSYGADEWGTFIFPDEKRIAVPAPCRYIRVKE